MAVRNRTRDETVINTVSVEMLPDGRMNPTNASLYVGCSGSTLARWLGKGEGPKSVLVGGLRWYFRDDLDAFIKGD